MDDGGDGGDDGGDGGDGRIFPEHPGPILHATGDNISRKGESLTPIIKKNGLAYGIGFRSDLNLKPKNIISIRSANLNRKFGGR